MKKKDYLKPDVKIHQVKPTALLAGSLQGTANTQELETETGPTAGDEGSGNFTW